MNTQDLLSKLAKALVFKFPDATKPGITISYLPHNKAFYLSMIRWHAGDKTVVFNTQAPDINACIIAASNWIVEDVVINPIDELKSALNKPKELTVSQEDLNTVKKNGGSVHKTI